MQPYLTKENLYDLLDGLNWAEGPWTASHQGAGIYAALVLQGEASLTWQDWYFDWLYENADPDTGLWRKGAVKPTHQGDSFSGTLKKPPCFLMWPLLSIICLITNMHIVLCAIRNA